MTRSPERRLPRVIQSIRELARETGAGCKLPTLNQLVEKMQVSRATVIRALEYLEQQGILVRRHGSGIYAAEDLARTKVLVIFNSTLMADVSPIWGMLLRHLVDAELAETEQLVFEFTSPSWPSGSVDPLQQISSHLWGEIRGQKFGAAIIIGADSEISWAIEASGVRTISFAAAGRYIVQMSQADVCQRGCQELAAQGCKRVAVMGAADAAVLEFADTVLRQGGSRLVSAGPGGIGKPTVSFPENRFDLARRAFQDAVSLFAGTPPSSSPDGVVMLDDMYTQGFLHGLASAGRTIGKDVLVATHTNRGSPALIGFEECLIRLEYDPRQIVDTVLYATRCVIQGVSPTEFGWDSAVVVEGRTAEIEILTIRCELRLPIKV